MGKSLYETYTQAIAKWLSCNGEPWGIGPTAVFVSAAVLYLHNELEATFLNPADRTTGTVLEKMLMTTMLLGLLALMTHVWVCSTRLFEYYLDTIITDSPNVLLEMTTAGLLQGKLDKVPLGPLTKFLRQQQPQIHITICWFVSLCYADYVRKHYCHRFNFPYLEEWQTEMHERASRNVNRAITTVNSFVGALHARLRSCTQPQPQTLAPLRVNNYTVRGVPILGRWKPVRSAAVYGRATQEFVTAETGAPLLPFLANSPFASSVSRVKQQQAISQNSDLALRQQIIRIRRVQASSGLAAAPLTLSVVQSKSETPNAHT